MRPIASQTTTVLSKVASAIGTQHGERGLTTPENLQRIAAWLASRSPDAVDSAAVSRASSHGVTLRVRVNGRGVYDDKGNMTGFVTYADGCDIQGSEEGRASALADLRNFMTPAPVREIEKWLAELSVLVVRKGDDDFGDELRLTAYAGRLARYPADVVRHVLLDMSHKFWPAWQELEAKCNELASKRRAMIAALEAGPPRSEPERRPPTPEERARIVAFVAERFPGISQAWRDAAIEEILKGNCMEAQADDLPLP